jgi:hypothetical protein
MNDNWGMQVAGSHVHTIFVLKKGSQHAKYKTHPDQTD